MSILTRGHYFFASTSTLVEPTNDLDMETLDLLQEMQVIDEQNMLDKVAYPRFRASLKSRAGAP